MTDEEIDTLDQLTTSTTTTTSASGEPTTDLTEEEIAELDAMMTDVDARMMESTDEDLRIVREWAVGATPPQTLAAYERWGPGKPAMSQAARAYVAGQPQRTDPWKRLRVAFTLTGAEIGRKTGLGYVRSGANVRQSVLEEIEYDTGKREREVTSQQQDVMDYGSANEGFGVEAYEVYRGWKLSHANLVVCPNAGESWLAASPDALALDRVVEVKVSKTNLYSWMPYWYIPQTQTQMRVAGRPINDLVSVYLPVGSLQSSKEDDKSVMKIYQVSFNAEYYDRMTTAACRYAECVLARIHGVANHPTPIVLDRQSMPHVKVTLVATVQKVATFVKAARRTM